MYRAVDLSSHRQGKVYYRTGHSKEFDSLEEIVSFGGVSG
jgi:hypothetical protein